MGVCSSILRLSWRVAQRIEDGRKLTETWSKTRQVHYGWRAI